MALSQYQMALSQYQMALSVSTRWPSQSVPDGPLSVPDDPLSDSTTWPSLSTTWPACSTGRCTAGLHRIGDARTAQLCPTTRRQCAYRDPPLTASYVLEIGEIRLHACIHGSTAPQIAAGNKLAA
eukprot:741598-Rhodomonas_salina.1